MLPDFAILTYLSEILAFSKAFLAKIFKSPNFSQLILLVSPLDYPMSIVVTFRSGGASKKVHPNFHFAVKDSMAHSNRCYGAKTFRLGSK